MVTSWHAVSDTKVCSKPYRAYPVKNLPVPASDSIASPAKKAKTDISGLSIVLDVLDNEQTTSDAAC